MNQRERLLKLVEQTRYRSLWLGSARAGLAGITGLGAGLLLSAAVLPWVPDEVGRWLAAMHLALALLVGAVLGVREWRRARPRVSRTAAAKLLTAERPVLRDLVLTGADIAAWGESGAQQRGASAELAAAQVDAAARAARRLDPRAAVPARDLGPWALRFTLVVVLFAGWVVLNPGGSTEVWAKLFFGGPPELVTVGNLQLLASPPAYTGLAESRLEGVDGSVEGYSGTRVTLSGELSRPVGTGSWKGPANQTIPLRLDGREFSVTWILGRGGSYRLSFAEGRKVAPTDFTPRSVTLLEDERPRVEMSAPEGDLEVSSDQEVEVIYEVSDDFRVEQLELVLQGDEEVRLPVAITPAKTCEGKARFLPLAHPELGEGAHLRIEAWDNDNVSGPKVGVGPSVYVSFLDKRRLMDEIAGLEERLLEALLTHLADHLELAEPAADELERLRAKGRDLLRLFEQLVDRVQKGAEEGALGALAVLRMEEGLRAALDPFLDGGNSRESLIEELERDILFLDRLLKSLRMEEALSLGDELAALQRSLFDDLEAGASLDDLASRVDRIQQLLAEMAQKMSHGAAEMPDAFANADAVQNMPANEVGEMLEELREALAKGDREAARELAEKLLETLSRWMAALEEAAQGATGGELDPVMKEIMELEQEIGEITAGQEEVLGETQSTGRDASERATGGSQEQIEGFLARQERRLQTIQESAQRIQAQAPPRKRLHGGRNWSRIDPQARALPGPLESGRRVAQGIAEVRKALREDLRRVRELAPILGEAVKDLRGRVAEQLAPDDPKQEVADGYAERAQQEVRGLLEDLDRLGLRRLQALTPQERARLQGLAGREQELAERTGEVAERLGKLAGQSPFLDQGLPGKAGSARDAMGEAGNKLGKGDPFGAVPPETRALEDLAELSSKLQGARAQMGEGMSGKGFQVVRSPGGRGGGRDVDRSPVEIPKEMEARELRAFREEVLKAMRSGRYPKDYEEQVERYYERLIR